VKVADASLVTPEMLHDPEMSVLLCMHVYTFGEAELKWHVFEGETFCHIHGAVRKCGKYLNTCLAPYISSEIPKYAWGSDSMITIFRLPKLTLPEMKVRFLCAKIQRFMSWTDESAMTKINTGPRADCIHRMPLTIWLMLVYVLPISCASCFLMQSRIQHTATSVLADA